MDELAPAGPDGNIDRRGMVSRVVSGDAGFGPLVLAPATVLAAVWIVMGETSSQWDVISLAIGLAWVVVAQVSVLAHVRRSERRALAELDSEPAASAPGLSTNSRRYAIAVACCLFLVLLYELRAGTIGPPILLTVFGSSAALLAAYEIRQWSDVGGSFPWSTVAIGCAGMAVVSLQFEPEVEVGWIIREVAISIGVAGAIGIWMGLLVRDVREIRA